MAIGHSCGQQAGQQLQGFRPLSLRWWQWEEGVLPLHPTFAQWSNLWDSAYLGSTRVQA